MRGRTWAAAVAVLASGVNGGMSTIVAQPSDAPRSGAPKRKNRTRILHVIRGHHPLGCGGIRTRRASREM